MPPGLFSKMFDHGSPESQVESLKRTIKERDETIRGLQGDIGNLRYRLTQIPVVYQAWKPGPPIRPLSTSAIGLPCNWLVPCLREIPPELARTFEVQSFSIDSKEVYQVDLASHSCTCPDFAKRRAGLPQGHALRCCKHISWILKEAGLVEAQDELVRRLLDDRGDPERRFLDVDFPHGHVLLEIIPGKEWVNVFAPKRSSKGPGEVSMFGYDQAGKRWSYGTPPFKPTPIKEAINALFCGRSYA